MGRDHPADTEPDPVASGHAPAGRRSGAPERGVDGVDGVDDPEDAGGAAVADQPDETSDTDPGAADTGALSDRDLAVLALERQGQPAGGTKERIIRERLDMSPTRYYQLLNALLDDPLALRHDPVTVNRLRRVRAARRARR